MGFVQAAGCGAARQTGGNAPAAEKYGAILELADRHRVLPLLYDVLAPKLPEEVRTGSALRREAQRRCGRATACCSSGNM